MRTQTVAVQPPPELVSDVQRIKQHFPYRICWGAFNPANPADRLTGADVTKRRFNKALRAGFVGFQL